MALVRDPAFWRRFSRAIHLDAEAKSPDTTERKMFSDDWLENQNRKKRRGIICCVAISGITIVVVVAVIVVLWWFGTHHWTVG